MTVLTSQPAALPVVVPETFGQSAPASPDIRLRPHARLVGREENVAHIKAVLNEHRWRGLLLTGPAGTGKSRLLQEVEQMAREAGSRTLWVQSQGPCLSAPSLL